MERRGVEGISVVQVERAKLGSTDAGCVLEHSLKYGLQIAGRTRNDAQHLGGRRLLLQRLGEFAREYGDIFLFGFRVIGHERIAGTALALVRGRTGGSPQKQGKARRPPLLSIRFK